MYCTTSPIHLDRAKIHINCLIYMRGHTIMKVLMFLVMVSLILSSQAHANEQLVFSTADSALTPVNKRIVTEAYKRIGFKIQVERLPAARALRISNKGDVDGELFRIADIVSDYPNLRMIPIPIYILEVRVFSKDVEFSVNGWESLKPYNIGIIRGVKHAELGTKGMNRHISVNYNHLFQMLDKKRVDIVVAARLSGLESLAKLNLKEIKMLDHPVATIPIYHFLHKKHERLIPKLTEVLRRMEKEGTLQKIRHEEELNLLNATHHTDK